MLTTVTITGADDRVDPATLAALSDEFPYVEWGILISTSRAGTPRYPSVAWIRELLDLPAGPPRIAAHLCGAVARAMTEDGHETYWDSVVCDTRIGRVQINGYEPPLTPLTPLFFARLHEKTEFILQAKSEEDFPAAWQDARAVIAAGGRASVLFNPSGGRGLEPFRWPPPFCYDEVRMGYAGGIGPDNVESVVGEILMGGGQNFWIDMESGVRDAEDRFDIGRVREVLEQARRFVR